MLRNYVDATSSLISVTLRGSVEASEYLLLTDAIQRDVIDHARRTLFAPVFEEMNDRLTTLVVHPVTVSAGIHSLCLIQSAY